MIGTGMLDVRRLETLMEVARAGSFAAAAEFAQRVRCGRVQRLELVEDPRALGHDRALRRKDGGQGASRAAGPRRRESIVGQDALGGRERIEMIGLSAAPSSSDRALDLEHHTPGAGEVLTQAGAILGRADGRGARDVVRLSKRPRTLASGRAALGARTTR